MRVSKRGIEWGYVVLWVCFVFYVSFTLFLVLRHEPWIDEIYAWQISKFSISEIFYEMRYEGHFALWSLILYPFSHGGLPLKALGIVSWALNALAVFYFAWKAPFKWWAKIPLMLSFPFLYRLPVISRCYVLIPLLLFPLANHFSQLIEEGIVDCKQKNIIVCSVLVAFLANTHVYMEGFVAVVSLYLFMLTVRNWSKLNISQKCTLLGAFLIILIGVLVAFAQVYPSLDNSSVFKGGTHNTIGFIAYLNTFSAHEPLFARIISWLLILAVLLFLWKNSLFSLLVFIASCLFIMACAMMAYWSSNANSIWFFILIFCLWLAVGVKKSQLGVHDKVAYSSILMLVMSLWLATSPRPIISDIKTYYSGESRFASFISKTISKDTRIYSNPNAWCCVIEEYLPEYQFYNVKDGAELYPRRDRLPIDSVKATYYLQRAFDENQGGRYIYVMDCVFKQDKDYMERYNIPYQYEVLYPKTKEQRDYFLQYYLLKVYRPM